MPRMACLSRPCSYREDSCFHTNVNLADSGPYGVGLGAQMRGDQPDLIVGNFRAKNVFERFEPVRSQLMACGDNLVEYFRGQPLRLQIDFATLELFRDQCGSRN